MDADGDALAAKQAGATRYCMGAAWREVKDRDMDARNGGRRSWAWKA